MDQDPTLLLKNVPVQTIYGLCGINDCLEKVTDIAYNRKERKVLAYCVKHARMIADDDSPEYIISCPNCDCMFGVN